MDGVNINIGLLVVAVAVVCKMVDGYRKGMVKEIVSLISMVVLCLVAPLIGYGVNSYYDGKVFNVLVVVILLILLAALHRVMSLILFPAKLASKLPVIHFVDKLLGIVFGAFEVVLILWTVYAFMMIMDMGVIAQMFLSYVEESEILTWIYQHNYLVYGIEHFLDKFDFVPLIDLLHSVQAGI